MPYADLTEFAANPDVEKIGDLYTVDMLVQYVQSKLRGLSGAGRRSSSGVRGPGRRASGPGDRSRVLPDASPDRGGALAGSPSPSAAAAGVPDHEMDLDRQVPGVPQRPVRPGDQEPDSGRGAPARPLPRLPGDAGVADHRGPGPDRRDPGRRGGRVRREGRAGQDPPRRVLRGRLRGRPA